ncbi:MAG: GNAT family N-acetyltransferase [Rhodococcus sp. (in: high G+C Gram-positive bacteria)]
MTGFESTDLLYRQIRTGLPADVLAVPAPPVPQLGDPYEVRIPDPDGPDPEVIADWMQRPHLVEAWDSAWPVPRWRDYLRAQLAGSYSVPLIYTQHGVGSAYVELYRAAQDSIARCYYADPHDIGVHIAIADDDNTGRGLGPAAFAPGVLAVFRDDPQCNRIMYDPDHRNASARRALESVGATFLGEHETANRRRALYATVRAPDFVPTART